MISERQNQKIDKLAEKIVDLFHDEDCDEETALQAMTRVIAVTICDQSDIPAKIKALVHNIGVLTPAYREKYEAFARRMIQ